MKAAVYEKYGAPEVLQIKEVENPSPKKNEVLIKIHSTTVTKYDTWMRSSTAPPGFWLLSRIASGITRPKIPILGLDLAGEIEAVGKDVKRFEVGDQVYGFTGEKMSTLAEFICMPEEGALALKPENMSYEEAACVPYGVLTALYFLRKGDIQRGQKILVFGASGGVGMPAVQLAKYFGAEVTGVCSTLKLDLVRSLGADKVIDYTKEDFTKNGEIYDIIFDTVGKTSVSKSKRSLKKNGNYIFATFGVSKLIQMLWISKFSNKKITFGMLEGRPEDLIFLKELIEDGRIRAVVDRTFPLEKIIEAHKYVEKGQKKGNVVISIDHISR